MSNRLEWREISTQGINPNEGLRTYMSGLQNAHAATNTMRENQRVDDQNAIKGQSGLLNNALKIDTHLQAKEQQAIANDQKDRYLDQLSKGKAGKTTTYDRLALENFATKHFEQGGTLETLAQNEDFRNTFDTTNSKVLDDLIATQGRYKTRIGDEYSAYTKLINERYDRDVASLPTDMTEEGLKAATDQYALNRDNALAGATDLFNSGKSIKSRELNQQLNGTAPSSRNKNGSVELPSLSRVKAVDTLRESVISDTDQRKAELEQQLEAGMSLEDYNAQMGQLESYRDTYLQQIDNDANKANITSFTGATVGVDYSIGSSGSLVVGGKNVPEKVGNALIQAAELTGQPLDILLPFVANESAFDPNAVSEKGVKGLMQVTGDTAKEVYSRHKDVFDKAGVTYDPKDRFNPESSALLGALYIGEIREKLGNDAPMESVYMAYNLGPNDKLINPLHDRDTPIDQLVPVSAGKISIGLDNNRGVYQNKDGTWKTLNQAAEEIRRRAGVSDITLSDPVATIEEQVTAYNRANGIKVPTEPSDGPLVNYTAEDFSGKLDSTIRAASDIVNRYIPTPDADGKGAKPVIDLSKGEIETMLAAAGIEDLSEGTVGKLFKKITDDDTLNRLNSDQIGMLLSWTPKGNFTKDIDVIGLDRNIEFIKNVWTRNETALKANMDDAILAKKLMSDFQSKANPLKDAIRHSEQVIAETELKLKDDTLSSAHKAAYRRDIDTHTNKRIQNIASLNFQSENIADRIHPLLNNIASFTKTMEETYANKDVSSAKAKVNELASNPSTSNAKLSYLSGLISAGAEGHVAYRRATDEYTKGSNEFTFTGNPFKDYAAQKRLSEGKDK